MEDATTPRKSVLTQDSASPELTDRTRLFPRQRLKRHLYITSWTTFCGRAGPWGVSPLSLCDQRLQAGKPRTAVGTVVPAAGGQLPAAMINGGRDPGWPAPT